MVERFKRPSIVTPEEIERASMREQTGDMVPSVMRQSTEGTTGSGFIDRRMGEGLVQRVKNRFFPSREESARRQTERTNAHLSREAQPQGFVPEGDYFQGLKGSPIARANRAGMFAPEVQTQPAAALDTGSDRRITPSPFRASQYASGTTEVSTPLTRSNGSRFFTNQIEAGANMNQLAGFEENARSLPRTNQFNRGAQGVYSEGTGRFAAPDDERAQRTRDFAARRGIPQMSETSPGDRILAQQEAAINRFRRGENLPGEMIGADGITYMRGSRMDGGTGIVGGGSSGGLAGNAAAEVIGAARSAGQRRGLRRDAAAAAEASKNAFEQQYKTGMLEVGQMNALANYATSQRQTPGKNQGVVKVNMGAVDLMGNALPDTLQLGNITIPLDDQGQQMLLSLRDELVRTGRATSAEQAWQLAGEAYALGLGTELQQQQE